MLISIFRDLREGFSTSALMTFWEGWFSVVGTLLCILESLAESLVSTHQKQIAYSWSQQLKCLQILSIVPWGGKIQPVEIHWCRLSSFPSSSHLGRKLQWKLSSWHFLWELRGIICIVFTQLSSYMYPLPVSLLSFSSAVDIYVGL